MHTCQVLERAPSSTRNIDIIIFGVTTTLLYPSPSSLSLDTLYSNERIHLYVLQQASQLETGFREEGHSSDKKGNTHRNLEDLRETTAGAEARKKDQRLTE